LRVHFLAGVPIGLKEDSRKREEWKNKKKRSKKSMEDSRPPGLYFTGGGYDLLYIAERASKEKSRGNFWIWRKGTDDDLVEILGLCIKISFYGGGET